MMILLYQEVTVEQRRLKKKGMHSQKPIALLLQSVFGETLLARTQRERELFLLSWS